MLSSLLIVAVLLLILAASIAPDVSDSDLARRIRLGDQQAFKAFFDRYHGLLSRYLLRRKVDAAVCEDLVQNAFVHIWEHRAHINPDKSLRAYLFRIGYTRALNHFRDTAKFDKSQQTDDALPASSVGAASELSEYNDVQAALRKAVAQLPERRRAVFELCFIEQLSYKEAAHALGISVKTIENQMGHALKSVRKAMKHFLPS